MPYLGVDIPHRPYNGLLEPAANPDFQTGVTLTEHKRQRRHQSTLAGRFGSARTRMAIHAVANAGQFFTACGLLRGKLPTLPSQFEGYLRTPGVHGTGEREGARAGDTRQRSEA
jgi:hypothetical protein